ISRRFRMRLDDYQQQARATMRAGLSPRDALLDAAAGLSEEAGEVLSHVRKHAFFDQALDPTAVKEELGDALWCIAAVATDLGLSLGDVAAANLRKIEHRARAQGKSDSD
ncbi:MAG: nucleoside triphosphate pyrophosphohydrolase family protein, partial [Gemmatimonadaceae bacterium]